jgi:hypothetical protein
MRNDAACVSDEAADMHGLLISHERSIGKSKRFA